MLLVLGVVRCILRGRDVIPHFAHLSGSAFKSETFAMDRLQIPILTPCVSAFLMVVFGPVVLMLRSAVSVNVTSHCVRSFLQLRQRLDVAKPFWSEV